MFIGSVPGLLIKVCRLEEALLAEINVVEQEAVSR